MLQIFHSLLLATEHGEFDTGAERIAFALARNCKRPLAVVLPLVSNPEYEALVPQIAAKAEQAAASKIQELQGQARSAGLTLNVRVRRGEEPYQEILEEAKSQQSSVIVIRRRGKRGFLANLLIGEMVSKVVAHSPCHVLIAPRQAVMWSRHILVAAQPNEHGQEIVRAAASVAQSCNSSLTVVTVVPAQALRGNAEEFMANSLREIQQEGLSVRGEIRVGHAYSEILACRESTDADLIVVGKSNHQIGRAHIGSVAQKIMGLAEFPVLVLRF